MTRTRDEEILVTLKAEGCSPVVFAEGRHVVYIPTGFAESHKDLLEKLGLKFREDDTFMCPARSLNTKKALWGYNI